MRVIPIDSETVAFGPGNQAPQLVCIQYDDPADGLGGRIVTVRGGAVAHLRRLLTDPDALLVGHGIAYDLAVWCAAGLVVEVFAALDAGRVHCTWVTERLGEIAGYSSRKKLDLATCLKAHGLPAPPLKEDGLQTTFGQFRDALEIPEPWRTYALDDLLVGKLYARQVRRFSDVKLSSVASFTYTAFWLRLVSVWGLLTDPDLVEAFRVDTAAQLAELRPLALEAGFLRTKGPRNMAAIREAVELAYGSATPRTPTGKAQTSALVLSESGDPALQMFAHYGELLKAEAADIPMLQAGRLHPRFGFADTGRTTCSRPNIQNFPGGGLVRQCIRPGDGACFLERDYSGVELCTFAAVAGRAIGDWSLAEAINSSGDPGYLHAMVGGRLLGISPEELLRRRKAGDPLADDARTRAKNLNFGRIGGLGRKKYKDYVRMASKGKIVLTDDDVAVLWPAWEEAVPAGLAYLRWVGTTELYDGTYEAHIDGVDIVRRGLWYCASANCRFQGLAAGIMHRAGRALAKACYLPGGRLSGVRIASFVHDSFTLETPDDGTLHDVDLVFEAILREAGQEVMPEVLTVSEGHAAYSLAKKVQGQKVGRVLDKNGRLIPWTPKTT